MSHPPLPPNCPMLRDDGNMGIYLLVDDGAPVVSEALGTYSRQTIAAVAEVAWRKEAERHDETLYAMERVGTGSDGYRAEIYAKYIEAMAAAEQWRAWGEKAEGRA
jgi:hypothetical protein